MGWDASICGDMLAVAVGRSTYSDDWTSEEVKIMAKNADWNFTVTPPNEWAKESAKAFLNQCAKLGKGVTFSW